MKLLCLSMMIFSFSAFAVKVDFATVAPAGTPWADALEKIKKDVSKGSKDKIKVNTHLGGSLGGELEILRGVRSGRRIQGAGLTSAALGSVIPELNVLEIPYIFDSSEEADYIIDNYLHEPFKKLFEKKGLILVTWAENGWRSIGHKSKLIKLPKDLKDVKIRSQESESHLEFWKALGASPQAIAVPNVLSALQSGVVDAFDNTPLFTLAAEWHTGIKKYSLTEHIYQPAAVVYSEKFWKKLKPEQQKILMGEGNKMAPEIRSQVRKLGDELVSLLAEQGVQVYPLTKPEKEKFKEVAVKLTPKLLEQIGGESKEIYKLIQKGKEEFRKKKK